MSRSLGHHNQSDDDLLMDQHNNMGNPGKKGSRQSQGRTKPSIGELVASDNRHHKKARRSRGESESNARSEAEKTGKSNKIQFHQGSTCYVCMYGINSFQIMFALFTFLYII